MRHTVTSRSQRSPYRVPLNETCPQTPERTCPYAGVGADVNNLSLRLNSRATRGRRPSAIAHLATNGPLPYHPIRHTVTSRSQRSPHRVPLNETCPCARTTCPWVDVGGWSFPPGRLNNLSLGWAWGLVISAGERMFCCGVVAGRSDVTPSPCSPPSSRCSVLRECFPLRKTSFLMALTGPRR